MKAMIAFRATKQQRQKLESLAIGEGTTLTRVITRLIDEAPVKPVEVVRTGLAFDKTEDGGLVSKANPTVFA